ncbi:MAG: NADH-quinone oxidoreductase subunit NuoE [Dehalococcoidales bacterium]|nr:NADH-quinone oxidoreductase subunit NuoE [Dehalococcoidales bacterium]
MREKVSEQSKDQGKLLVLLKEAQDKHGYLSREILAELAESLNLSLSDVYGVASFYSFLFTKPLGRNVIRVCKSLPCYLKNSQIIMDYIEKEIGIRPGETTSDGKFSFELTNCIGACDKAPAMMINQDVYGDLTPEKVSQILAKYK